MKYLITVAYDGSKFFGFQRLNNEISVQGELERVLTTINKSEVLVKGAGRTDRGVHAFGQRAHFELDIEIPCDRLQRVINSSLNDYVRVNECIEVEDDFHARFEVLKKKYVYKINLGEHSPFLQDYMLQNVGNLDIELMKNAAKNFLGVHNFELFTAGFRDDYTAIIYEINFQQDGEILIIEFSGKSFYRYMVRNLVGTLLEVGKGKVDADLIKSMLENPKNHKELPTAIANGLYLVEIVY